MKWTANHSAGGPTRVLIAGGGTGGHLFPGIALAEELVLRNQGHHVLFLGTRRGLESRVVPQSGFDLELIEIGGLKGKGLWGWMRGLLRIPRAIWQSRRVFRRFRPHVVVGVGGYAAGPAVLAAWLMRIPTVILEQNALPGFTNRVLGRFVRQVVIAFEEARRFFPARKVLLLGNPVRKALVDNFLRSHEPGDGQKRLLVFGGSQGARKLNEVLPTAVELAVKEVGDLQVIHQSGTADLDAVVARYRDRGLSGRVQVETFIEDMATVYRQADLVVCRSGATSVAELTLCRKPAVLIPYPYAADNHQEINARSLVDAGAAVMIRESELSAEKLAGEITGILSDRDRRIAMENAAGSVSRPAAASDICEVCIQLASGSPWRERKRG